MTIEELHELLRKEAEAHRRALIAELTTLEDIWGFPRSVLSRDERRQKETSTHP